MDMTEYRDGYEYLEMLRQENKKQTQSFNDFSEYLEGKARKQGIPVRGQFELTPFCNLNCKMCYVHLTPEQAGQSLLMVDQWKKLMHQAYDAGMYTAALTGGECLTYPGFEELYLYLQDLGCVVDVMTNGVLLDEAKVRFFQEHRPGSIQITLYGGDEDTYERVTGHRAFSTVLENIRRIREAGLLLIVTVTPSRSLGEGVFDTIRTACSLSTNVFINTSLFSPSEITGRKVEDEDPDTGYYVRLLRYFKEIRGIEIREYSESELPAAGGSCDDCRRYGLSCGGGRSGFVINWKGEMLICNRMEPKSFPLQNGFSDAWQKIRSASGQWPRAAACSGCAYESICGICAADALKYAAPGEKPEALCRRTRYMASKGVLSLPDCT